MPESKYDGFYFVPTEEENSLNIQYFTLNCEEHRGSPINNTSIGDMFHVAFFRASDDGHPVFDDAFEAILADPITYVKALIGTELFGCVLRKTENSGKWWDEYLTNAKNACKIESETIKVQ